MTETRTIGNVTPFTVPTLSAEAAFRDRGDAIREHGARLRDAGFRAGYEDGLAAAAAERERLGAEHRRTVTRLGTAIASLESATVQFLTRDAATIDEMATDAISLAVELASEIVGREVTVTDEPVLDALARAAQLVPDRGTPRIRVHPDDAAAVRRALEVDGVTWPATSEIVSDPAVEPGGCIVDVDACRVDAQITGAIERMRVALT